uniref:NAD(P)(+)--arginine ADP-ribosyltransferase n=1 Tax=Scleropages formosus TaxID=113540 RepID=A0A8D0CJV2_SCLFO
MAQSTVDDQYLSCTERMMANVTDPGTGLLWAELKADPSFQAMWEQMEQCANGTESLTKHHAVALALIAAWNRTFPDAFDRDVEALGPSSAVYRDYFPSKALHFLLTDAVRRLRVRDGRCRTVYGVSKDLLALDKPGSEVRLGQFFHAFSSPRVEWFDLTIKSCHAAILPQSPCATKWWDVLVPPYEKFRVVAVKKLCRGRHLYLESSGVHSNLECALFPGGGRRYPAAVFVLCLSVHGPGRKLDSGPWRRI